MFRRTETPSYTPAQHLLSRTPLTAPQLIALYEDFRNNLQYASAAPELVFERLVGNLSEALNVAVEREQGVAPQSAKSGNHTPEKKQTDPKPQPPVTRSRWFDNLWWRGDPPPYEAESGPSAPDAVAAVPVAPVVPAVPTTPTKPTAPVVPVRARKNPVIGSFNTYEFRTWEQVRAKTSKVASFATPYSVAPGIPVGLSLVDIGNNANPRVKSYTSEIRKDNFRINLDSWEDTKLHSAECRWLEIEADNLDFQFGSYNTYEDHPWYHPQTHNSRQIRFARPYPAPPTVVVWLTAFDMDRHKNWRIKTFATNVTKHGFTIHVDTWEDSVLYSAIVTWVAYPSDKPGICSGRFSTLDFRSWRNPQMYNSRYEKFGNNVFSSPPRTLLALDSLDIDHGRNLRLKVKSSAVTAMGMTWHLDAWQDTIVYSAGASYIAMT